MTAPLSRRWIGSVRRLAVAVTAVLGVSATVSSAEVSSAAVPSAAVSPAEESLADAAPVSAATLSPQTPQAPRISGTRRAGHRVTLEWDGPQVSETGSTNPFLDYRLDVTFINEDRQAIVPGHFAADGDAADTGAASGRVWRVHFRPDAPGTWNYSVSFRTGSSVAIQGGGQPTAFDGTTGTLHIDAPRSSDLEAWRRGPLRYTNERYLRYAFTGEPYLEGGTNSPENLFAYVDFDNTVDAGGIVPNFLHEYAAHRPHYASLGGGPTWQNGKGTELVGAINWLESRGVNAIYLITLTAFGDGDDVWPFIGRTNRYRYDVSKLDQWDLVLSHAAAKGMHVHLVLTETENESFFEVADGTSFFGASRKLYFREMVSRFGHLPALTWNLGEENGWDDFSRGPYRGANTHAQRVAFAEYVRILDSQSHPIAVHTYHGPKPGEDQDGIYGPMVDPNLPRPEIEVASLQGPFQPQTSVNRPSDDRASNNHAKVVEWVERSQAVGKPWIVSTHEQLSASIGALVDGDSRDPNHDTTRRDILWGNLMGGGSGVQYYFGYSFRQTSGDDLTAERFDSREDLWQQTEDAIGFFQTHLPFTEMQPRDDLVEDNFAYCLADPGEVYAIYLRNGGQTRVDLDSSQAIFEVRWFDPRNGGPLQQGSLSQITGPGLQSIGTPPNTVQEDWVAVVTRQIVVPNSGCAGTNLLPTVSTAPQLGARFKFTCPPCAGNELPHSMVGFRPSAVWQLFPPIACPGNAPCILAVDPTKSQTGSLFMETLVPANPALVGAPFRVQCGCISTCATLSQALELLIEN